MIYPTPLGFSVVRGDMEVSPAVLVKVGQALGVEGHARVAAAYLIAEARNAELFQNMLPQPRGQGPLLPMQLAMSVENSDVLTAVQVFRLDAGTFQRGPEAHGEGELSPYNGRTAILGHRHACV